MEMTKEYILVRGNCEDSTRKEQIYLQFSV